MHCNLTCRCSYILRRCSYIFWRRSYIFWMCSYIFWRRSYIFWRRSCIFRRRSYIFWRRSYIFWRFFKFIFGGVHIFFGGIPLVRCYPRVYIYTHSSLCRDATAGKTRLRDEKLREKCTLRQSRPEKATRGKYFSFMRFRSNFRPNFDNSPESVTRKSTFQKR